MMMDCRQVKRLLPLWVGQDLPDAAIANEVARHLEECHECNQHRIGLQASLEVLQASSSSTLVNDVNRNSVWPKLAIRMANWDRFRRRERFNGWIPASVMALAVALMIAVSLPSIREEFLSNDLSTASVDNVFEAVPQLEIPAVDGKQPVKPGQVNPQAPQGTPVKYRFDQW